MKTNLLTTTILLFLTIFTLSANGRVGTVTATIVDAQVTSQPVVGAVVEFAPKLSPDDKAYYSSDMEGRLLTAAMLYGDYTLTISFLGYETSTFDITLKGSKLDLGVIEITSSSVAMDTVVKEIKALRTSQSGDSLRYNASSYKVAADADVEGLLQKMPGITISDGTVTAQGETITKIYVDGREFFGDDVTMALKSLPAEVVDRIEVFDKKSDEAENSGIDDGNTVKTINIVTKPNMRRGIFGKVFAGGGYEPDPSEYGQNGKYMMGGSVNVFRETSRFTIVALLNNLNQQSFSFEDITGVSEDEESSDFQITRLPGIAKVGAVGINYSDVYGEDDKVKVQGSYFYNKTTTSNIQDVKRWYEAPATDNIDSMYQHNQSVTPNLNHRVNGRIDWKINKRSSMMIRPTFSFQSSEPMRYYSGTRYDDESYEDYDNEQSYASSSALIMRGYNIGASGYYRLSLNDNGRSVSAGASFSVNSYDSVTESIYEPNSTAAEGTENTYKYITSPSSRRNYSANVNYNDRISEGLSYNLTYRVSENYQESDKRSYTTEEGFSIEGLEDDDVVVNYAESRYFNHRAGVGMRYRQDKTRVSANIYYENSALDYDVEKSSTHQQGEREFNLLTYSLMGNITFNPANSLQLRLYTYSSNPPISRYQDYLTSTSYVTKGNTDLDPSFSTRMSLRYTHSNIEKARTLMMMLYAVRTTDYLTSHIVLNPSTFTIEGQTFDEASQFTTWVNLDTYWYLYSNITYGMPLDFIKCNLNIGGGVNYTVRPSILGGEVQDGGEIIGGDIIDTDNKTYRVTTTLGSNVSEKVDFTLAWRGEYNDSSNISTSTSTVTKNRYIYQSATAAMKLVFVERLTFTGSVAYKQYRGITNIYNDQYVVCNAFVGCKVLRDKRGEINVGVNDMLNQNVSYVRYVGNSYTQNYTNLSLGRYYSMQFIYNIRLFGRNASKNIDDYDGVK